MKSLCHGLATPQQPSCKGVVRVGHNCCTIGCDQNVVRVKKFASCFMNVRMKKMLVRKHARVEAPVVDRCATDNVMDRAICLTSWCVRCATKASVVRWSDSMVWVIRWSVDGPCVNMIGCMVNVRSWEPSFVCSYVSLVVVVIWYSGYAPSREEVLVQQHPWFSLESQVWSKKYSLLIRSIYTSGQVTCNGSTTLQDIMRHVLQHSHGRITHAYKGENHLATFEIRATLLRVSTTLCNVVRLFVRPSATIWIAKCWLFKIQRQPDATILSHKTNAMHRATEATGRTNC